MSRCIAVSLLLVTLSFSPTLAAQTQVTGKEPVVVSCEGCMAVFQDLPQVLNSKTRLSPASEPGEPLLLSGTVYNVQGQGQAGIVVYAYQTNANGVYPRDPTLNGEAARHGRLRGWAISDAQGRYSFQTIRPGAYPETRIAQHIHLHVIEPARCTYYIGDVLFDDDPLLDEKQREAQEQAFGGNGIVQLSGDRQSGWVATRDIRLGLNVARYAECGPS